MVVERPDRAGEPAALDVRDDIHPEVAEVGEHLDATQDEAVDDAEEHDGGDDVMIEDTPQSLTRKILEWVLVIVVAIVVATFVKTYLLSHFIVSGHSMDNTLQTGDHVFVNKLSYRMHDPNRGDVVVIVHPIAGVQDDDLIKRVIGLPGETVEIHECNVYIDGMRLDEPYLSDAVRSNTAWCEFNPVTVPEDQVFVMGDNRPASSDSRVFGAMSESDLVGRAFAVFWPFGEIRWL